MSQRWTIWSLEAGSLVVVIVWLLTKPNVNLTEALSALLLLGGLFVLHPHISGGQEGE